MDGSLDQTLEICHFFFGDSEFGSRRRLESDHELTRVSLRKVRETKLEIQEQTRRKGCEERYQHCCRPAENLLHEYLVPSQHPTEGRVESPVEARRQASRFAV